MVLGKMLRAGCGGLALFVLAASPAFADETSAISDVSVSRPFFSPSLGQKIEISLTAAEAGALTLTVVDRNGRPVRALVSERAVQSGKTAFDWDGRDDKGQFVPDDAYAVTVKLKSHQGVASFSAQESRGNPMAVILNGYDRRTAVLSYTLPKPGRVRIEARAKGKNGAAISRVVVRDEPRTAGAVIDVWDGYDERHTVYLPDLPGFEIVMTATELPENAILTTGAHRSARTPAAKADARVSAGGRGEVRR